MAENDTSAELITLANKIQKELVDTNYYDDVKYNLTSKSRWKFVGDLSEAFSQILIAVGAILAFASGFFGHTLLAFIAGCVSTGAIVFKQFSSYCARESSERTRQVNKILKILGLKEVPDIVADTAPSVETV